MFLLTFRVAVLLLVGARDGLPSAAVLLPDRGRDAVARDGGGAAGSSLPERVRVVRRAVVAWPEEKGFFLRLRKSTLSHHFFGPTTKLLFLYFSRNKQELTIMTKLRYTGWGFQGEQ